MSVYMSPAPSKGGGLTTTKINPQQINSDWTSGILNLRPLQCGQFRLSAMKAHPSVVVPAGFSPLRVCVSLGIPLTGSPLTFQGGLCLGETPWFAPRFRLVPCKRVVGAREAGHINTTCSNVALSAER